MVTKILVTGGAGYIGSHVVLQLSEAGYDVVVYDNCSTGAASAVLHGQLVVGDLADRERLHQLFAQEKFTAVIHLAGSKVAPESVVKPLDYYANNSCNTLTLLRCCQTFGVDHFVFSSTAAVYGEVNQSLTLESAPTVPINPYGRSKLINEWMIQDYAAASGLRYLILRYFNVAGADPKGRIGERNAQGSHLIKVACDVALGRRESLQIFGTDFPTPDGTAVRDYIHVWDLATAHLDALHYLEQGGQSQVLNCGYGRGYSVREVVKKMKEISGVDFPVVEVNRRKGDPASVVASVQRIREVLGWMPNYDDLGVIVETTWEWYKQLVN